MGHLRLRHGRHPVHRPVHHVLPGAPMLLLFLVAEVTARFVDRSRGHNRIGTNRWGGDETSPSEDGPGRPPGVWPSRNRRPGAMLGTSQSGGCTELLRRQTCSRASRSDTRRSVWSGDWHGAGLTLPPTSRAKVSRSARRGWAAVAAGRWCWLLVRWTQSRELASMARSRSADRRCSSTAWRAPSASLWVMAFKICWWPSQARSIRPGISITFLE